MNHHTHTVEFRSAPGSVCLRGRFIVPETNDAKIRVPLVIMLTGDGSKGTKSPSWTNLPPRFVEEGIAVFLPDFAGLGYSDGNRSELTVSVGMANFRAAFEVALEQGWVDSGRIGILASSFGATVALLQPELVNRTQLLGLKSPACFLADAYVNEAGPDAVTRWLRDGHLPEVGYSVDVLRDALFHNVYLCAREIRAKVLITHGDRDSIVPLRQSELLVAALETEKRLEVLRGVGHSYAEDGAWEAMSHHFVEWFSRNL